MIKFTIDKPKGDTLLGLGRDEFGLLDDAELIALAEKEGA